MLPLTLTAQPVPAPALEQAKKLPAARKCGGSPRLLSPRTGAGSHPVLCTSSGKLHLHSKPATATQSAGKAGGKPSQPTPNPTIAKPICIQMPPCALLHNPLACHSIWRKVWPGTPVRALKHRLDLARAARKTKANVS